MGVVNINHMWEGYSMDEGRAPLTTARHQKQEERAAGWGRSNEVTVILKGDK